MTQVIIVEKTGILKQQKIKDCNKEQLYKKANFKKADGFELRIKWKIKGRTIELWAKDSGRANFENKYDFPPPVDSKLYFGNCILIDADMNDLTIIDWNIIYEKLFGGFEDLSATAEEDENEVDELDKVPDSNKTKQGYLKDGFVVDTNSEDDVLNEKSESEAIEYSETEEDEEVFLSSDDENESVDQNEYLEKDVYIYSSEDDSQ